MVRVEVVSLERRSSNMVRGVSRNRSCHEVLHQEFLCVFGVLSARNKDSNYTLVSGKTQE